MSATPLSEPAATDKEKEPTVDYTVGFLTDNEDIWFLTEKTEWTQDPMMAFTLFSEHVARIFAEALVQYADCSTFVVERRYPPGH